MNQSKLNEFKLGRSFLSAIAITIAALFAISGPIFAQEGTQMSEAKPTIVLVHGAFADSGSWAKITRILLDDGYPVFAASNPLRGVKNDAEYISTVLSSIKGPIVLVGHSYGGMVISNTPIGSRDVEALVYVDAFAPKAGEDAFKLSMIYPGSTLGPAILPVPLPDGVTDLYQRCRPLPRHVEEVGTELPDQRGDGADRPLGGQPGLGGPGEHVLLGRPHEAGLRGIPVAAPAVLRRPRRGALRGIREGCLRRHLINGRRACGISLRGASAAPDCASPPASPSAG